MANESEPNIELNNALYGLLRSADFPDGWDQEQKIANFHLLTKITDYAGYPLTDSACLDVGCGTGDMSAFLRDRGVKGYVGTDIFVPSVADARRKYPDELFLTDDIRSWIVSGLFDYAFSSGALSTRTQDNYSFLKGMVGKMWELTTKGVAFNFINTHEQEDPDIFFYNNTRVLDICKEIVGEKGQVVYINNPEPHNTHSTVFLFRS